MKEITRNEVRDYLKFVSDPPKSWVSTKIVNRYIDDPNGLRAPNPEWRPFVVKVSKVARRHGKEPVKSQYQLSNKSMEAIFAVLSSLLLTCSKKNIVKTILLLFCAKKKDI